MSVTPDAEIATDGCVEPNVVPNRDAAAAAGPAACLNCGGLLVGTYCTACGQKTMPAAPTFKYFLHELTHEVVNVDGRIFCSLRLLVMQPGYLTREIFAGRRASYVSPIRLYLIASVLAFGLRAFFGAYDYANFEYTPGPGEIADPAALERAAEVERTINTAVGVWLPRAMFLLVPLFAALVMLFRRRGGHTYPQHLYFALHLHAVWFFASAAQVLFGLVALPAVSIVANVGLMLYFLWYYFVAFQRAYETTTWGTSWRTVAIGMIYLALLMATVLAIAAPTFWPAMLGPRS